MSNVGRETIRTECTPCAAEEVWDSVSKAVSVTQCKQSTDMNNMLTETISTECTPFAAEEEVWGPGAAVPVALSAAHSADDLPPTGLERDPKPANKITVHCTGKSSTQHTDDSETAEAFRARPTCPKSYPDGIVQYTDNWENTEVSEPDLFVPSHTQMGWLNTQKWWRKILRLQSQTYLSKVKTQTGKQL